MAGKKRVELILIARFLKKNDPGDIFPTICELLEIEKPAWLDGTSVMPIDKMRTSLDQMMKKTGDPLINGFIVAPPDAVLNDPNDISPNDKTYMASDLYKFNQKK